MFPIVYEPNGQYNGYEAYTALEGHERASPGLGALAGVRPTIGTRRRNR